MSIELEGFIEQQQQQVVGAGGGEQQATAKNQVKEPLTVANVDWSIEVLLATNTQQQPSANGVPMVNLTLTLSDGTLVQRRLTTAELHKWRYNLARATKDVHIIESRREVAKKESAAASKAKAKQ